MANRTLLLTTALFLTFAFSRAHADSKRCLDVFAGARVVSEVEAYYEQMWEPLINEIWKDETLAFAADDAGNIKNDSHDGDRKRAAYERLGFTFAGRDSKFPTFKQFIANFTKAMDELGVPENERLYPALVLVRKGMRREDPTEIRLVTPGKDPWPNEPGFRINHPRLDVFNLSVADTMKAHRAGRFPLMALHDVNHFVAYVRSPAYMRAIRRAFLGLGKIPKGSSFYSRFALVSELLILGNPRHRTEMQELFATPSVRKSSGFVRFSEFIETMKEMSDETLLAHAVKLASNYDRLLVDYGGGAVGPGERDGLVYRLKYGTERETLGADDVIQRHFGGNAERRIIPDLVFGTHGAELSALLAAHRSWPMGSARIEALLTEKLGANRSAETGKDVIMGLIREEAARTEFFLWNSSRFTAAKWVQTLLNPGPVRLDDPIVLILRESLGTESHLYRRIVEDHARR